MFTVSFSVSAGIRQFTSSTITFELIALSTATPVVSPHGALQTQLFTVPIVYPASRFHLTAPTVRSEPVARRTQTLVPSVGVTALVLASTFSIVTFINVFTSPPVPAQPKALPTFALKGSHSVQTVLVTPTDSLGTFIYVILTARPLEPGRTDTSLGVSIHTPAPIQTGCLTALSVHAASLGVQLLPAMTTLVFGDNKSPVILLIRGEVLSSSFVSNAPVSGLSTVRFPHLGYPGKCLSARDLDQPRLHVLIRTDIRHSGSKIVCSI